MKDSIYRVLLRLKAAGRVLSYTACGDSYQCAPLCNACTVRMMCRSSVPKVPTSRLRAVGMAMG